MDTYKSRRSKLLRERERERKKEVLHNEEKLDKAKYHENIIIKDGDKSSSARNKTKMMANTDARGLKPAAANMTANTDTRAGTKMRLLLFDACSSQ